MSLSPTVCENSPEPSISNVCKNLEMQFMEDLSKAEALRVFARVRPMLNSETEAGHKECIGTIDDQTVRAVVPSSSVKYKNNSHLNQDITEDFKFTAAYGPEVGQFVFFEESMMNTMQNFIEGQNSLVFSYGITGSGKTFTLQGDVNHPGIIPLSLHLFFASVENHLLDRIVVKPEKFADVTILNDNEIKEEYQITEQLLSTNIQEEWSFRNSSKKSLAMILCDTFSDKFQSEGLQTTLGPEEMAQAQAAAVMKELGKKSAGQQNGYCSVWVSFVEIYNEYIYDLLQPNVNQRTKLTLGEDKNGDVYVKGLREVCVFNSCEALKLLNFGQRNLKIASTKLNYQSSRSHCIFTIKVVRIPDPKNITCAKVSRLSFCDLAGSERAAKSQTTGLRLKEAGCINTSLLVLGRCLEQLRLNPSLRDKKRIPFRESKLTRLLSGFFTGRGKAVMITNVSPSEVTFDETLHALRFSALATNLIINDSYIATASNTLQTITNMWNARGNISTSSDKSINFEDSTVEEALQEKDELIEKLLDLAESLTNNLEKEKKEKAELEIKIREEVCQEYSEFSDELLECQKKNHEEEQEAIREIYKKRISAMEKMYESIIKDLKLELEESDLSCDEAAADTNSNAVVKNGRRKSAVSEKSFKGEASENIDGTDDDDKNNFVTKTEGFLCDMEALKEDLETLSKELKSTKDELEKSKDYCQALESATEEMEKKLEISNSNLEKALTENGELKIKIDYLQASYEHTFKLKNEDDQFNNASDFETLKEQFENIKSQLENTLKMKDHLEKELDSLKIDCLSYKVDNEDLFKKKIALEEKLQSLSEELASTKSEKEDLCQKLSESEKNVADLGKEANVLLERTNELTRSLEESKADYEKSLEEAKKRAKEAEEVMISVNKTLDSALIVSEEQKEKLVVLENECACLREKNADILKRKEDLEKKYISTTEELEFNKTKVCSELEKTLQDIKKLNNELDTMKTECLQYEEKVSTLEEANLNLAGKVSSLLKELDSEKVAHKQELDTLNSRLNEALSALQKEKTEVEKLLESNECLQKEISDLQDLRNELMDKLSIQTSKAESEVLAYKENLDTVNSKLAEALSSLDKQKKEVENLTNVINVDKKEIAELQKQNKELLDSINSHTGSLALDYRKELDAANTKLVDAFSVLDKQKQEMEELQNLINSSKNEIVELQKQNTELQDNMNSQIESETMDYKTKLDAVNSQLDEALYALDIQKQEVQNLTNIINSDKNEITELQKQNKELNDINSQTKSENGDYKKELDAVNSQLDEALASLDKQKQEVENLTNVINSDKNEIAELQKQNKELQDNINSRTESETMDYKKELDFVKSQLDEALSALDKQKHEVENLTNVINSEKNEIAELQKQNKKLQDTINSRTESENEDYKKELDAVNSQLDEALASLDKQKQEVENLTNVINSEKNEITQLQKQNKELQDNIDSRTESETRDYKKELDSVKSQLDEALSALDKQKQELDNLTNVINSDKNEIAELQKQNKELQDNINSKTDSETMDYKKELDAVNNQLDEALSALDKQKQEVENLTNVINSEKNEISELQKQNKELQDNINSKTESEHGDYKEELDAVNSKLDEALSALHKQKQEVENLTNIINSDKNEIAQLQKHNKELHDSTNSEIEAKTVLKQELDSVNNRLQEALCTIDEQKEELRNKLNECDILRNKIAAILKIDDELQEKINSQGHQTGTLYELINVLEKCEKQATHRMDMVQSDLAKFKGENKNLKEELKKKSDDQKSEFNCLHKMIQILQQCEVFASNKTKELHTCSIKQVEQIMDLEKCNKERDAIIESLKNDYNLLQKQLKSLQTAQLQTAKLHRSEIDNISNEKKVVEKENKTLKYQLTQLETLKDRLETEMKNMKTEFEKVLENKNQAVAEKEKLVAEVQNLKTENEKITKEKKKVCQAVAEKEKLVADDQNIKAESKKIVEEEKKNVCEEPNENEECKTDAKTSFSGKEKTEKKTRQKSKEKNESKHPGKDQGEKRKTKSSGNSKVISEDKKSKTVIYEEEEKSFEKKTRRKNNKKEQVEVVEEISERKTSKNVKGGKGKVKSKENSEVISEDQKSKTVIYEETDESTNSENTQKVRNSNRRRLRTLENVTSVLALGNNRDLNSTSNKGTKRKGLNEVSEDKLHDKKILKKIKLQDINEIENFSNMKKPQNLRIELLKGNIPTNDIPLPSPRMTRGRKRLFNRNIQESTSQSTKSPRTLRS